jgi:hypothetical protein
MDQQGYAPEGEPIKFCHNCGAKIDKSSIICPACGASQTGAPGFGSVRDEQAITVTVTGKDLAGLKQIRNASLVSIIGIILSLAGLGTVEKLLLSGITSRSPASAVSLIFLVGLIGGLIGLISIVQYRSAFGMLRNVDVRRFDTPNNFTTVFIVGFVLFIIAMLFLLGGIDAKSISLTVGSLIIIIISALLLILGDVGVIILGLWRVGDRYDITAIGIGAIFYIIPYFDVLAPILVFIGAHSTQHKLKFDQADQEKTLW